MTKTEGPTVQEQTETIRYLITKETERIARGKSAWSGLPLSHIPSLWDGALNAMLASGEVETVKRPRARATRPGSTVTYVRFAK